MRRPLAAKVGAVALVLAGASAAQPRIGSLDQCADQYVLALAPRKEIAFVSPRAREADSALRAIAAGLPQRRADLESVLAARPSVVVRYWGGDPALLRDLQARGVRVVTIADATTFAGVGADTRAVAAALGRKAAGDRLVTLMDKRLAAAKGAWGGAGALYVTSGGFTAGRHTLVGAMLDAAGLADHVPGGYRALPLEALALAAPAVLVEGFFAAGWAARQHWSPMRNPVLGRIARGRRTITLPASLLGCPAWFAADAAEILARQRSG